MLSHHILSNLSSTSTPEHTSGRISSAGFQEGLPASRSFITPALLHQVPGRRLSSWRWHWRSSRQSGGCCRNSQTANPAHWIRTTRGSDSFIHRCGARIREARPGESGLTANHPTTTVSGSRSSDHHHRAGKTFYESLYTKNPIFLNMFLITENNVIHINLVDAVGQSDLQ